MNRTTLLQERRMQTFQDVLGYWQARRLSALEAAELLGMSERSFRRYRQRYEEEGPDGLFDRRLGKASARRVPADQVAWVLDEYRSHYRGWTVKHFHDRLRDRHGFAWSYTWTKTTLQRAGLVPNPPEPPGQGTQPRRHHRDRGRKPLHRRELPARPQPALRNKARARSQRLRVTASARPGPRGPVPAHKARGRARQHRAPRKTGPANPRLPGQTPLRQGHGPGARVSRRHSRPLPRTPMPRPLSGRRRAHRHIKPAGRVSRFDATRRCPVGKWAQPWPAPIMVPPPLVPVP